MASRRPRRTSSRARSAAAAPRCWRRRRHHHDVGGELALGADDPGHRAARRLEPLDRRVGEQRDVGVLERRPHAAHMGIGLAVGEAREAVEAVAAHAPPRLGIGLVQVDADGQVERVQALVHQVIVQLLDARLVGYRGIGELVRPRRLGGVLAGRAVDEVEPLGLGVVRLEHRVVDRPGGRHPAVVADLLEVALAEAEQDRAVDLRVAADEVLRVRAELAAVLVDPALLGHVALAAEHLARVPVLGLAWEIAAALEQQDALPDGASRWASVPPPAPVPMMITS